MHVKFYLTIVISKPVILENTCKKSSLFINGYIAEYYLKIEIDVNILKKQHQPTKPTK